MTTVGGNLDAECRTRAVWQRHVNNRVSALRASARCRGRILRLYPARAVNHAPALLTLLAGVSGGAPGPWRRRS